MTWRFSAEYANGRSNDAMPTVHATPRPTARMVTIAVATPTHTSAPPSPRRRIERRAIAYFHASASTRVMPATRCAAESTLAAASGRSQAMIPVARSVVMAASSARFASRLGTLAMLVPHRCQTGPMPDRDLVVLSEDPFNAETRLDERTPALTPAGRHYVRTHFSIPAGPQSISIDAAGTAPKAISLEEVRALPARSLVVTLECAGNGRRFLDPRAPGEQWGLGAVGTARWTGASLRDILGRVAISNKIVEVLFRGADEGV
ncbi:MAG: hypothetical protein E6J13_05465, partial [Chloroflexi bacterium]